MKTNFARKVDWWWRRWCHETRGETPPLRLVRCTPRLRDKPWFRENVDATVAFLGTLVILAAAAAILHKLL